MEGKKILDLSHLSDEHYDSIQKAVYRCMGSDEPGSFSFATHTEVETCKAMLNKAFESTACKGVVCGGLAVIAGYGMAYATSKIIKTVSEIQRRKELLD